ncbi:LacI family DNA-binding transcriptional regulator [Xylophilus sp. GW821-FHT01B05]
MSTLKDVAALAGVSFTTVSHVLRGTRRVNDGTRARVEQAVSELGYLPSAVARSLKTRETHILGVLVPNVTNPFFAELTRGIEDYCRRSAYSVFLCNSDDDPQREASYWQTLMEHRVDGLLVASTGIASSRTLPFQRNVPLVMVDRLVPGLQADVVRIDNQAGARLAVEHLLALGHRNIACLSGPSMVEVNRIRQAGWQEALATAGIVPGQDWLAEGDFGGASGYRAAQTLLAQKRFSAIFACNDMMALGALRAAAELGIAVPQALSIIGFDGIDLGAYTSPPLTTVGHSIRDLGERAAALLIERIATPAMQHREIVLRPHLMLRESTATFQPAA